MKNINHNEAGYSLIELLLAIVVGSIVLAGAYASYMAVSMQYDKNSSLSQIHDYAIPTLNILDRDIRMAGFKAVDGDIEAPYGKVVSPVVITDSGSACCDSIQVSYDKATDNRVRITYFVQPRTNPTRNALYMDVEKYDGSAWNNIVNDAIVADYLEDFQVVGSDNNAAGFPTLINLAIVFKSKNKTRMANTFTKTAYSVGNYNFSITDNYLREEFETSILLRNLVD